MLIRWLLAALHLVPLGVGFAAIWTRALALRGLPDPLAFRRVFAADTIWGMAALLWIGTGLLRAFAGYEKGTAYYMQNHVFWLKMGLLAVILILEFRPMIMLIRWRIALGRNREVDTAPALWLARISVIQAILVLGMVFAASAMARGTGIAR